MSELVCARLNWSRTAPETPMSRQFYTLHVGPEPGYPFGRKGLALAGAWAQLSHPGQSGMLLLDGDVIIDPEDLYQMLRAVGADDAAVHTAPVRIWPASTHKKAWTWAHWAAEPSQQVDEAPRWFSFCFTYLPRALIDRAVRDGLPDWTYPSVDSRVSQSAQAAGLRVRVVPDCWPKHINY
jgi:hypothetical protein